MKTKIKAIKMTYKAPIVEKCFVITDCIIAASNNPQLTVGLEQMEDVTLGDDGFGNNDILLNY